MYVADTSNYRIRKIMMPPSRAFVTTFAGNGVAAWVDGYGVAASFSGCVGLGVDLNSGFVFAADSGRVRMISPGGAVTTLAGSGASAWLDGVGTAASFFTPSRVYVAPITGNVIVADLNSHTFRSVTVPGGVVTTLMGTPNSAGYANGNILQAKMNVPRGLFMTSRATYIADALNYMIRKVTCPSLSPTATPSQTPSLGSTVSPTASVTASATPSVTPTASATASSAGCVATWLAGSAAGCNDGTAYTAQLGAPTGLAMSVSGTLYFADSTCHTLRLLTASGAVLTLAGMAATAGWADGAGSAAMLSAPWGVALSLSGDTLFFTDAGNHAIRSVTTSSGAVTTLAGQGSPCFVDGSGFSACFSSPYGIAFSPASGLTFIADSGNCRVRSLDPSTGVVATVAGKGCGSGAVDGPAGAASFSALSGLVLSSYGTSTAYVCDASSIRAVALESGAVATLAGTPSSAGFADAGSGVAALLSSPLSLALSPLDGALRFADTGNQRLRKMALSTPNAVRTLAGMGGLGAANGAAPFTTWANPSGLAIAGEVLYIADKANSLLRTVTCPSPSGTPSPTATLSAGASASGAGTPTVSPAPSASPSATPSMPYVGCVVTTVAGLPGTAGFNDGRGGVERFNTPSDIAFHAPSNTLWVAGGLTRYLSRTPPFPHAQIFTSHSPHPIPPLTPYFFCRLF